MAQLGSPERSPVRPLRRLPEKVALAQGSYYLVTGLWPFLHMRSFLLVTGPKTDLWLVRTVGALVGGVGAGLVTAALRGRLPRELRLVSVLCAAGLITVEVPTALRGRISSVYLLDAAVELGFVAAGAASSSRPTTIGS